MLNSHISVKHLNFVLLFFWRFRRKLPVSELCHF